MTAVLTNALKRQILNDIYTNVADSAAAGNYYIGIGRAQQWDDTDTPVDPVSSLREERNMRLGLQSIKQAESVSYVVPRNNWSSSTIYDAYDDNVAGYPTRPYYVLTEDSRVYICLQQGRNTAGVAVPSTVKPNTVTNKSFKLADGYIWKFLYTLTANNKDKFLSSAFMPVEVVGGGDSAGDPLRSGFVAATIAQKLIQDSAVVGQIASLTLTNGGSGYTSVPTLTIAGDGDSATGVAVLSGGSIVDVKLDSNGHGKINHGYTFTKAAVTISGGGGTLATARANISPALGIGADPTADLRATALMFNTKPAGTESGKFLVGQDFRQVALIKNPKVTGATDSDYTVASGLALTKMNFIGAAATTAFTADKTILGGTSGAKAYVSTFNATDSDYIYYHQDETTGFGVFTDSEGITEVDGDGAGTADSATIPLDINKLTGDILYVENRAAIDRSASQTEDIKVIIQI